MPTEKRDNLKKEAGVRIPTVGRSYDFKDGTGKAIVQKTKDDAVTYILVGKGSNEVKTATAKDFWDILDGIVRIDNKLFLTKNSDLSFDLYTDNGRETYVTKDADSLDGRILFEITGTDGGKREEWIGKEIFKNKRQESVNKQKELQKKREQRNEFEAQFLHVMRENTDGKNVEWRVGEYQENPDLGLTILHFSKGNKPEIEFVLYEELLQKNPNIKDRIAKELGQTDGKVKKGKKPRSKTTSEPKKDISQDTKAPEKRLPQVGQTIQIFGETYNVLEVRNETDPEKTAYLLEKTDGSEKGWVEYKNFEGNFEAIEVPETPDAVNTFSINRTDNPLPKKEKRKLFIDRKDNPLSEKEKALIGQGRAGLWQEVVTNAIAEGDFDTINALHQQLTEEYLKLEQEGEIEEVKGALSLEIGKLTKKKEELLKQSGYEAKKKALLALTSEITTLEANQKTIDDELMLLENALETILGEEKGKEIKERQVLEKLEKEREHFKEIYRDFGVTVAEPVLVDGKYAITSTCRRGRRASYTYFFSASTGEQTGLTIEDRDNEKFYTIDENWEMYPETADAKEKVQWIGTHTLYTYPTDIADPDTLYIKNFEEDRTKRKWAFEYITHLTDEEIEQILRDACGITKVKIEEYGGLAETVVHVAKEYGFRIRAEYEDKTGKGKTEAVSPATNDLIQVLGEDNVNASVEAIKDSIEVRQKITRDLLEAYEKDATGRTIDDPQLKAILYGMDYKDYEMLETGYPIEDFLTHQIAERLIWIDERDEDVKIQKEHAEKIKEMVLTLQELAHELRVTPRVVASLEEVKAINESDREKLEKFFGESNTYIRDRILEGKIQFISGNTADEIYDKEIHAIGCEIHQKTKTFSFGDKGQEARISTMIDQKYNTKEWTPGYFAETLARLDAILGEKKEVSEKERIMEILRGQTKNDKKLRTAILEAMPDWDSGEIDSFGGPKKALEKIAKDYGFDIKDLG